MNQDAYHQAWPVTAFDGQWVSLRPVSRQDYPLFLAWRTDILQLHLWSFSRRVPTIEEFELEMDRLLRASVTLVAVAKDDIAPIGFVQAYNINPVDSWCFGIAYFQRESRESIAARESFVAFLDYLFRSLGLRKVYLDVPEFNSILLSPILEAALVEEGRFREHIWYDDRYWDITRFALYRDVWPETHGRARLLLQVADDVSNELGENTHSKLHDQS